ncbi:MAG: NAD(P)-dependent oxidoreductase [Casimicrobiaceae bacterium]
MTLTPTTPSPRAGQRLGSVAVIGTGAMGGGVVESLVRAGVATRAHDIDPAAQARAVQLGAQPARCAAAAVAQAEAVIVLVVTAEEVDAVLFGTDGVVGAMPRGGVVIVSSTVDPDYLTALAPRLAAAGLELVDAPVSGGPAKAAAGTMTMMIAGNPVACARVEPTLAAITGRLFVVGPRAGEAAMVKIVNNLLAAANLAAGAEALALARRAGLDARQVADIIAASSGASWIFGDRVERALTGDLAPRAATRVLLKDVGIAVDVARRLRTSSRFAEAAQAAFAAAVAAGHAEDDDAAMFVHAEQTGHP